jgi:site-specific recombinase XerD
MIFEPTSTTSPTSKGNSNAASARKLAAIKSFFNYLIENEELETSPVALMRSPKIPEKEPF